MTVKEYLSRAQNINDEIKAIALARQNAKEAAMRCSCQISDMPTQHNNKNTNENKFLRFAELGEALEAKLLELNNVKSEILSAINSVADSQLRALLIHRYINFQTWEQIAEYLNKSDKWVRTKMHTTALLMVKINT